MRTRRKSTQLTRKAALAQACTLAHPEAFSDARAIVAAAKQFDEWIVDGRVPEGAGVVLARPRLVKPESA